MRLNLNDPSDLDGIGDESGVGSDGVEVGSAEGVVCQFRNFDKLVIFSSKIGHTYVYHAGFSYRVLRIFHGADRSCRRVCFSERCIFSEQPRDFSIFFQK